MISQRPGAFARSGQTTECSRPATTLRSLLPRRARRGRRGTDKQLVFGGISNFWNLFPDLAGREHHGREDEVHTVTTQVAASSSRPPVLPLSSLTHNTMADNASGQPDRSVQVKLVLLGMSSKALFLYSSRACSLFANKSPR